MIKKIDREGLIITLTLAFISVSVYLFAMQLSSPLSIKEVEDINAKANLSEMRVIKIGEKEFLGCGRGSLYKVPLVVINKQEVKASISYCPGNWVNPSELKF